MADLTFEHPWVLIFAIVVPLLLPRIMVGYRQQKAGVVVPFFDRLASLIGRKPTDEAVIATPPQLQRILLWFTWVCIIVALARPQRLEKPIVKDVPTRDMLLAVDLSGSMETKDFTDASGKQVDRLTAVKQVLDDFLTRRKGDRVGLIFFGSAAFVQAPFTEDLDACRELLDEAQVRMAGPKTALGDAIGLALTLFEHETSIRDRVLIALTDGNDTGSQVPPDRAAEIAHERNIVIHTVAVGDPTAAGEEKLDETTLKDIAKTTGGRYSRANDRSALEKIYEQLDALEVRHVETMSHRPRTDLFYWPLAAGLLATLFYHAFWVLTLAVRHEKRPLATAGFVPILAAGSGVPLFTGFEAFHFLRPWWLLAAVPAIFIFWMVGRYQDSSRAWRGVIADHLLPHLMRGQTRVRWLQPRHLLLAVSLLSTLALAGPAWQREPSPFADDNAALVIAIKVTPTMLAQDVEPSRLERAALKVRDLLKLRPGVRTALIAYSGSAHLVLPLTSDASLVEQFADELSPSIMPRDGDVPAEALALADEQLKKTDSRGSILLIADSISADEQSKLAAYRANGGAPVQVLALAGGDDQPLPADSPPAPALDRNAMQAAVDAVGGTLSVVTPDDADVKWLAGHTVTSFVSAAGEEAGDRWRDAGYGLVLAVAVLGLFWFRPGWFVSWDD